MSSEIYSMHANVTTKCADLSKLYLWFRRQTFLIGRNYLNVKSSGCNLTSSPRNVAMMGC